MTRKNFRSLSLPKEFTLSGEGDVSPEFEFSDGMIRLSDYDQETYKMDNKCRGVALLINVMFFKHDSAKTREGSFKDAKRITDILTKLKFNVVEPIDTKKKTILGELERGMAKV